MLINALLAVFIAGLMVGRTPEFLGKKIQAAEMKLVVLYILAMPRGRARPSPAPSVLLNTALAGRLNDGPHGLTEILYAYASAANNNGSAFGGLTVTSQWYQTTLGLAMLVGRFFLIIPVLAIAGSLARKPKVPVTAGTFPTDTPLFGGLVVGVDHHRRRPHVLPRAGARAHRRAPEPLGDLDVHHARRTVPTRRRPVRSRPGDGRRRTRKLFDPAITRQAIKDSFVKLNPRTMARNPVMFVVEVGSVLTTILFFRDLGSSTPTRTCSPASCRCGCGSPCCSPTSPRPWPRAGARPRPPRCARPAPRPSPGCAGPTARSSRCRRRSSSWATCASSPPASSSPATATWSRASPRSTSRPSPASRRRSSASRGGDRSAVTGGTRVLSDEIVVQITSKPGETFLDRMIALVEGANRQKTPNEIALTILLAGLTIIFLLAVVTLQPFAIYSGAEQSIIVLVALLVCLIPTTIGALLSAIGIAGMDRLVQRNVLAMSGRAVEAAGDVSTLLLDKTGTITFGSRQAAEFVPVIGVDERELAEAAHALEPGRRDARGPLDRRRSPSRSTGSCPPDAPDAVLVPFTAQTRMSGMDFTDGRSVRKGAGDTVRRFVRGGRRHGARSSSAPSSTASRATAPRRWW